MREIRFDVKWSGNAPSFGNEPSYRNKSSQINGRVYCPIKSSKPINLDQHNKVDSIW